VTGSGAPPASAGADRARGERAGVAAMVVATLLWGATFVATRDTLGSLSPEELVAARFAVAAIVLVLAWLALGGTRRARAEWSWRATLAGGLVSGVLAALSYLFQAIGLTATSAGSSAFLTCTGTVLAAFLAWPMLGERPSARLLQGIALALAGALLLSQRLMPGPGERWTLVGAAVYALQIVAIARWVPRVDPVALSAIQALTVAMVLLPFAPGAPARVRSLDAGGLARFAYLAIAGSSIAPLLQVLAQRTLGAGRVALLFALEPVFGLLVALTWGAERFAARWWLGAFLILCGVARVEWRASSRADRPASR
jgi:drug/metabolite transporter (DMT)-like permease